MVKLESSTLVQRQLQQEHIGGVPMVLTFKRIYEKFLKTGSVEDRDRSGRPTSATTEKTTEIAKVLATTPIACSMVALFARKMNIILSIEISTSQKRHMSFTLFHVCIIFFVKCSVFLAASSCIVYFAF